MDRSEDDIFESSGEAGDGSDWDSVLGLDDLTIVQLVEEWYPVVIPTLRGRLAEQLALTVELESPMPGPLEMSLDFWNQLGIKLATFLARGNGSSEMVTTLYASMIEVVRESQGRLGRIHKGLLYHQFGWALLVVDQNRDAALDYFVLAYLEDLLTAGGDPSTIPVAPASYVLTSSYGATSEMLTQYNAKFIAFIEEDRDAVTNPELFLLENVPNRTIRTSS